VRFYFSRKQEENLRDLCNRMLSGLCYHFTEVFIDGNWKQYTEMCGEGYLSKWDDVIFIGEIDAELIRVDGREVKI